MSEETASRFHIAKMNLQNALEEFKNAGKEDERDIKEELLDEIHDIFGKAFLEDLLEG